MSSKQFQEFLESIKEDVKLQREIQGEGKQKGFVSTISQHLPDNELEDVHPLYLREKFRNRNVAVDGFLFNSEENTLYLIYADFHDFFAEENLTTADAELFARQLCAFLNFSRKGLLQDPVNGILEFSSPEYEVADLIRTQAIDRAQLLIFTDRNVSSRFKFLSSPEIDGITTQVEIWSLERLFEFYQSGLDHEPLELDFSDMPIKLTLAAEGNGFRSYLGVMPAPLLASLYQQHGGRLLEGNVRSYLMLRTDVNKSIRGTILRRPERFFIYNNGIAVTAKDLVFDVEGNLVGATDFQIINGGQTTASLARAVHVDKADVSDISVALKLTEVEDTLSVADAQELMRDISFCSNNQNKVSGADFSSNHPFHIAMEQCSQRIVAPAAPGTLHGSYWFYERNRGSYLQAQMFMTSAKKAEFNKKFDKKRVIKKEDLARVHLCWDGFPDIVSKGAATLFSYFMNALEKKWDYSQKQGLYGDDFYKDTVALTIMYRELGQNVSKQYWFENAYRANIVAYTMAVFAHLFREKHKPSVFDLSLIWRKQTVPSEIMVVLLNIAHKVKEILSAKKDPGVTQNVTQWAKLKNSWITVQRIMGDIPGLMSDRSDEWCKSAEEQRIARHQAKADAEISNDLGETKTLMEYRYWNEALSFCRQKDVLTPRQVQGLIKASRIVVTGKMPTAKERESIRKSLEILRQEGFRY